MTQPPSTSDSKIRLLTDWTGDFGLPPFERADAGAFSPGLRRGAEAAHRAELDGIAANPAPPTFDNTIVALEQSGRDLDKVANVFFVKAGADTGDEIEAIERDISPLLARHSNAMYLDRKLYARIADLYARREALGLNAEQARLLDRYHTRFVRAGGALDKKAQDRLAAINERLATLGTQFGQNVLADEKSYALILDEADLAGLPDFARRGGGRRGGRARPAGQIRHHAGALVLRRLSAIFGAARSARESVSRPGSSAARTAARPTTAR